MIWVIPGPGYPLFLPTQSRDTVYYLEENQSALKYKQIVRWRTQSSNEIWEKNMVSRFSKITQE